MFWIGVQANPGGLILDVWHDALRHPAQGDASPWELSSVNARRGKKQTPVLADRSIPGRPIRSSLANRLNQALKKARGGLHCVVPKPKPLINSPPILEKE